MEIMWNEERSGWIKLESIETLTVEPTNMAGYPDPEGELFGVVAARSNGSVFVILVRATADRAAAALRDVSDVAGLDVPVGVHRNDEEWKPVSSWLGFRKDEIGG